MSCASGLATMYSSPSCKTMSSRCTAASQQPTISSTSCASTPPTISAISSAATSRMSTERPHVIARPPGPKRSPRSASPRSRSLDAPQPHRKGIILTAHRGGLSMLLLILAACAPSAPSYGAAPPDLVTADPNATATATPFQPGATLDAIVQDLVLTDVAGWTETPTADRVPDRPAAHAHTGEHRRPSHQPSARQPGPLGHAHAVHSHGHAGLLRPRGLGR